MRRLTPQPQLAAAEMFGAHSVEHFFFLFPYYAVLFCVLWVPLWLIGVYRWYDRRREGLPVGMLLKASALWPFAVLLISVIVGSLLVAYGNGPTRQADRYATELTDQQGTPTLVTQRTFSDRHNRCGQARYDNKVLGSGAAVAGSPGNYSQESVIAAAQLLGWSEITVTDLSSTSAGVTISGTKDHAQFLYELGNSGRPELIVDMCRDSTRAGNGQASESNTTGLDATLFVVVSAWSAAFAASYTLLRWSRKQPAAIRSWCGFAVLFVVVCIIVVVDIS